MTTLTSRLALPLVVLATATWARADTPTPTGLALADKVAACYAAEVGSVDETDRAMLRDAADELVGELGAALGAACADPDAGCAAAIAALDCAALAPPSESVGEADLSELAALLGADAGPPAPWAVAYATALRRAVVRCAKGEGAGEGALGEADAFGATLALGLTQLEALGVCKVHPSAEGACVSALDTMPCEGLAQALSADPLALLTSLSGVCMGLLACDAIDAIDAGALLPELNP